MVYLNSQGTSFKGGSTNFLDPFSKELRVSISPHAGLAVLFLQDEGNLLLHEGERIKGGHKYIFRTEVMYEFTPTELSPRTREINCL